MVSEKKKKYFKCSIFFRAIMIFMWQIVQFLCIFRSFFNVQCCSAQRPPDEVFVSDKFNLNKLNAFCKRS